MDNSNNRGKLILNIFKELLGEFINLLFGNVWNKVGLSILLLVLAMVCFLSPIVGLNNEPIDKPFSFYVVGGLLTLISIYLIARRCKELKEKRHL
jgi:hypothetical protein